MIDLGKHLRSSAAVEQNDISELIKIMSNLTDKYFPKVQLSRGQYRIAKKTWLTKGILKSITTQNKLHAKYKRSNSTSDHNIYKEYRNKLTRIKEKAKAMYYQTLFGSCGNISVTRKTIKNIPNKTASKDNFLPSQLNINGRVISNASSICNELNRNFCNIGKKMAKKAPSLTSDISNSFCGKPIQKSIYFEPVSENEVEGIISMFNPNKAQGIDSISIRLIKLAKVILSPYLTRMMNNFITTGQYPDVLKIARVTSIYKKGSKTKLSNYRPISILTPFNKIFEIVIKQRRLNFWKKHKIFAQTQFGIRENFTILASRPTHFREYLLSELDSNMNICSIFVDLAKAFNTVTPDILLYKRNQYEMRGLTFNLIKSYLQHRKQIVQVGNHSSSISDIYISVPQGSALGPTLFLIYK